MSIPPFSISDVLGGLPDAEQEFDVRLPTVDPSDDDPVFTSPLGFHVRFLRQGKELQVEVTGLSTMVRGECSRCATTCNQPIAMDRITAFVPIDGFDEDYPIHLDPKKGEADLSDWLRIEILAVCDPLSICRKDCKGYCTRCGKDLNGSDCSCDTQAVPNPFKELGKYFKK